LHASACDVTAGGARPVLPGGLVAFGFLDKDHRQNREAIADALRAYLSDAMPPIE
jgi:hypothetical protein